MGTMRNNVAFLSWFVEDYHVSKSAGPKNLQIGKADLVTCLKRMAT